MAITSLKRNKGLVKEILHPDYFPKVSFSNVYLVILEPFCPDCALQT